MTIKTLHLYLKFEYFDAIARGEKKYEYRDAKKWQRRLDENLYTRIVLHRGYQKSSLKTTLHRIYTGYTLTTRHNEHYTTPTLTCAIDVRIK